MYASHGSRGQNCEPQRQRFEAVRVSNRRTWASGSGSDRDAASRGIRSCSFPMTVGRRSKSCRPHHAVLRKSGFLPPGNVSLTFRGFGAGRRGNLCRAKLGSLRQKSGPSLWPRQTVSRQEFAGLTETGSNCRRDRFESGGSRWRASYSAPWRGRGCSRAEIRSVAAAPALAGFATMDTIGYINEESPTRELRHAGSWKYF